MQIVVSRSSTENNKPTFFNICPLIFFDILIAKYVLLTHYDHISGIGVPGILLGTIQGYHIELIGRRVKLSAKTIVGYIYGVLTEIKHI